MNRTRLMLLIAFVAAFAAGGVAGTLTGRPADTDRRTRHSLRDALNMTEAQAEQIAEIWKDAHRQVRTQVTGRRELRQQRDSAIEQLFTPEQLQEYHAIKADHEARQNELDAQRKAIYEAAKEKTRALLTPEQRAKFEEMTRRRDGQRGDDRPDEQRQGRQGSRSPAQTDG